MRLRKITRTKSGSVLVNLSSIIPGDWEYLEVSQKKKVGDTITIELTAVRVESVGAKVSEELSG